TLVEHALAVLQLAIDMDRSDLPARDAGIARVFGKTEPALHAPGDGTADVAGHALHFRIVEAVDDDAIVRAEKAKASSDLAGSAALRPGPDPADETEHEHQHDDTQDGGKLLHGGLQR